jgi:hypothetical protein
MYSIMVNNFNNPDTKPEEVWENESLNPEYLLYEYSFKTLLEMGETGTNTSSIDDSNSI